MADQILTVSVSGGLNGGALIEILLDGVSVYSATGDSPYNLIYTPSSGTFTCVNGSVTVTPSIANNTSPLIITFTGAYEDTLSIDPRGANSSWGYSYSDTFTIVEALPFFTVQFNANGGTGTMADQNITEGVPTPLNACTYTRNGYSFSGWSSYPSGPVEYADGETVTDLVAAGFLMPLYAIWERVPMQGTLYTNKSPKNMMVKNLTFLATFDLIFKDTTNIIDPVFLFSGVSAETIAACNYIYVPSLGRYYFVNKIETVRNNVWQLYCHVDVLSTYADQVKEQYAIVKRQEQNYNLYVNDGVFKVYQDSVIETFPFPDGFTTIGYVLCVAGN